MSEEEQDKRYRTPDSWLQVVSSFSFLSAVAVTVHSGFLRGVITYGVCAVSGIVLCRIIRP